MGDVPASAPLRVEGGQTTFEFVNDKDARLRRVVDIPPGREIFLTLDWRKQRINVEVR